VRLPFAVFSEAGFDHGTGARKQTCPLDEPVFEVRKTPMKFCAASREELPARKNLPACHVIPALRFRFARPAGRASMPAQ